MPGPSSTQQRFDRAALLGKPLHFLLDVTYAGRTFRLSWGDVPPVSSTELGQDLQYEGIIEGEPEWEEGIDLFSDSVDMPSLPLKVVLPCNVPKLVAEGHDLARATAELSLWIEGTTYEKRRVLLRGKFTDPEYAREFDPINTSIQAEFFEDTSLIPPEEHVISRTTWPNASDDTLGMSYPEVYGENPDSGVGNTGISPAYMVDTTGGAGNVILIAGHVVGAASVTVEDDAGVTDSRSVSTTTDWLGQLVSVVTRGAALGVTSRYTVRWSGGGARQTREGTGPLTGAGDVLEHYLSRSTLAYDAGRIAAAKGYLNRFKLCGGFFEGVSAWEYIQANMLPILPCSVVNSPSGLYVVPWRYDATSRDALGHIDVDADPTIELDGPVEYQGANEICNSFKLRYAINAQTGDSRASVTLSAKRNTAVPVDPATGIPSGATADPRSGESVYCRVSQLRYGKRAREEESTVVYDDATAGLIVSWWARRYALPSRTITYVVGQEWEWLERGNVVTLTDSSLYLAGTVCLVDNIAHLSDASMAVRLRLIEDPAREFKRAG